MAKSIKSFDAIGTFSTFVKNYPHTKFQFFSKTSTLLREGKNYPQLIHIYKIFLIINKSYLFHDL